ncbi:hypothetical protein QBC34DRAFT_472731, partial [Podospora aff. communis PSN243]
MVVNAMAKHQSARMPPHPECISKPCLDIDDTSSSDVGFYLHHRPCRPLNLESTTMRLINTKTLTLQEYTAKPPPYAILSHTWEDQEVTFQDMQRAKVAAKLKGFRKIRGCAKEASANGYEWIWVDTCCI